MNGAWVLFVILVAGFGSKESSSQSQVYMQSQEQCETVRDVLEQDAIELGVKYSIRCFEGATWGK